MDLCKEASTDNWRRCLHDCNVGLINEAKRVQERRSASVSAPKDTTISRALVALGAIATLMSVWYIITKNKKR